MCACVCMHTCMWIQTILQWLFLLRPVPVMLIMGRDQTWELLLWGASGLGAFPIPLYNSHLVAEYVTLFSASERYLRLSQLTVGLLQCALRGTAFENYTEATTGGRSIYGDTLVFQVIVLFSKLVWLPFSYKGNEGAHCLEKHLVAQNLAICKIVSFCLRLPSDRCKRVIRLQSPTLCIT